MSKVIKLVLSGSGALYPVHVGAIMCLAEHGYTFSEVCGTSGGALVAAALASGYKPNKELIQLIKKTLPGKNNLIKFSVMTLFKKWGLADSSGIEEVFSKHMPKTMAEVKIPLHIISVNIDRRVDVVFSSKDTPDMSLPRAIVASMSIPGIFAPIKIAGERHVDGGISANYFLNIFGTGEDVVGLRFHSSSGKFRLIKNIKDYILAIIETMLESNMKRHIKEAIFARTILLDSKYSGFNFKMTDKDVDAMIKEGYASAKKWLESHKAL